LAVVEVVVAVVETGKKLMRRIFKTKNKKSLT
jgi:hypothetical protein